MTYKLMGLTDEQRMEIEQASGGLIKTEAARVLIEQSVNATADLLETAISRAQREVQEVIGPHGSVTRLQAGGVKISPGMGISVYEDGVLKTTITPGGDLFVGSDTTQAATTSLCVFVTDQAYNNEEMGAGDLLIGDNSAMNVFYDASEGQLQFRDGTTVQVYIDTDGSLSAGGGRVKLDSNGVTLTVGTSAADTQSRVKWLDSSDNVTSYVIGWDDGSVNRFQIEDTPIAAKDSTLTIKANVPSGKKSWIELNAYHNGACHAYIDVIDNNGAGLVNIDAASVQVNPTGADADFRVATDNNANTLFVDGGEDRVEIGTDHYFPTRNSSNPNGFWNEANQDMDFTFEGDNAAIVLKVDAGLDSVGIGAAAESGYVLKVTGNAKVTGNLKAAAIENDTGLAAGTYTPTLTNVANLDSSTVNGDLMYIRVGNIVQVTGSVTTDATAAAGTVTRLGISLPIASNLGAATDLAGTGNDRVNAQIANLVGDTTNDRAEMIWAAQTTGSASFRFTFAYQVI